MTDDASPEAAGAAAGGPPSAAPAPPEPGRRSIFDLRAVAPLGPEEQRVKEDAMARALEHGAEPVRDARGWALEVDFIEANGEAVEPWKHDREHKRLYRRSQKLAKAAGQLIGQPGDREEWGKRLARQFYREGSDPEGAVRRGLFEAIWRFDHVYDSFTVPRRYGPYFIKTGRIAAVAEEARRKWQAEGLAPEDVFWVRNRRNTGLVLVTPNPDPNAPAMAAPEDLLPAEVPIQDMLSGQGAETVTGEADVGFGVAPQLVQANPQQQPRQPSMTADALFKSYRQNLAIWEGGVANRPLSVDPGGVTNKGISKGFLDELRKLPRYRNLPSDPRRLSDAQIDAIHRAENFDRPQIWKLAQVTGLLADAPQLVEQMFDAGVQHGIDNPGKWLQEALDETLGTDLRSVVKGKLDYDGIVGSGTRKVVEQAVKAGKITEVNNLIVDKRIAYMKTLPNYSGNPGWITRAESFRIKPSNP